MFYFQNLFNTAMNGIDAGGATAGVVQVAQYILMATLLFGIFQAWAQGGDTQLLGVTGLRFFAMGLVRLQTRSYQDNGGVKRYVTEVVAQNVILLGGANGNGSGSEERSERRRSEAHSVGVPRNARPEPEMAEMPDDPDVPF